MHIPLLFQPLKRSLAGALLIMLGGTMSEAGADVIHYTTTVENYPSGLPDSNISFQGVTNGTYDGVGPFSLGNLVVKSPGAGGSQVYNNAPIELRLHFDNDSFSFGVTLQVSGQIGPNASAHAVVAGLVPEVAVIPGDPNSGPTTFSSQNIALDRLKVDGPIMLGTSINGGVSPVYADVVPMPVPEPTVTSMVIIVAAGLGFRRWRRLRNSVA